jgi:ABC-type nitrate/sulfonate/bicarbonate transport systems, periplasmic components
MRRLIPIVVALAVALAACGGTGTSASPSAGASGESGGVEVINLTLNWFPLADHAAYYDALEKGYYTDAGLAVNILQGSGSGETLRRVSIGQADLGLADTGVVINGIRNGATAKMVMMVMDRGWNAIWAKKGSGITTVKDLCGKKIGSAPRWPMPAARCGRPWPTRRGSTRTACSGSTSCRRPSTRPSPPARSTRSSMP